MSRLNKGMIITNDKCIGCNRCISKCPVLGANVLVKKNGTSRIYVDGEKCIHCGICMESCIHGAREYSDDTIKFIEALAMGEKISIAVAPSFYMDYSDKAYKILGYLKELGVDKVYNVAFGADISTWATIKYIAEKKGNATISPNCPAVVNYIEKNKPELIDSLIPVHSPVMCLAIYVQKYLHDVNKIAFISPCLSKSDEFNSINSKGNLSYNVTFKNLMQYIGNTNLEGYTKPDLEEVSIGNIYAFSGGLKENIEYFNGNEQIVWKAGNIRSVYEDIEYLPKINTYNSQICLIDAISCKGGCILGPGVDRETLDYKKFYTNINEVRNKNINKLSDGSKSSKLSPQERLELLDKIFEKLEYSDYLRKFENRYVKEIPIPEETLNEIFMQMNKNTYAERHINCQSCGYQSCEQMVRAIAYGYSNIDNCIHYSKYKNIKALMTDSITGIPSENAIIYFLKEKITNHIAYDYDVIKLKIKNFTLINERYGSDAGDNVILEFSHSLNNLVGDNEIVARIGSNNYLVAVLKSNLDDLIKEINKINVTLICDNKTENYNINIRAGIYEITADDDSVSEIINKVSIAFANVNKMEDIDIVYFDETIRKQMYNEMMIRRMLPKALDNKEFLVYFQPKVRTGDKKLIGAEALVRWKINDKIIPPIQFIPICEKIGFVKKLDFYVLETVCSKIREWMNQGIEVVKISSNFSKQHFEEEGVAEHIVQIVDKYNVPHEFIEVEFTETAYIDKQDVLKSTIEKLKLYGISSSMDDFGSGYSSLSLLQALQFDVLKIDKSLLGKGMKDPRTQKIVQTIIRMAKDLELEIIAEGVETYEEFDMLRNFKCDVIQGYYFDKPLEEIRFLDRLYNKDYNDKN